MTVREGVGKHEALLCSGQWEGPSKLAGVKPRFCPPFFSGPPYLVIASILHLGLHVWLASKLRRKRCPLMISSEWLSIWGGRGPLLFRNKGAIHPPSPFFSIKYLLNFKRRLGVSQSRS